MAYRLKKTLQEVQVGTTSTEYILWMMWLKQKKEKELEQHDKFDFYMAQLTAETRRSWVSKPNRVKSDMFLIKFELKAPDEKTKFESADSRMQNSKSFWSAVLSGKKKQPPKG